MQVSGYIQAEVKINGVDIPYAPRTNTILASQNVNVALPTIRINILDANNIFDKELPLNDGATLEVNIGDGANEPRSAKYRVFGTPPRRPGMQHSNYIIHGILDAIPYVRANPQRGINGNASTAMQQIAQNMNFNFNSNTTTNDAMMWLPGRKTWSGFADLLARHGWADDSSALHVGVDMARNLHFHDINKLFAKGEIKRNFFYGTPPSSNNVPIQVVEQYKAENHSGMLNNTYGYGLRMPQANIGTGDITKFLNVKAMTVNNLIDMSKDILGSIGSRGRLEILPIHTANSHDNFQMAKHQNLRLKSTYSQVVHVLVTGHTGLTLFDMVQFSASEDDSVTGLYSVTGISSACKGRLYKEKIQLTAAGPENSNNSLV